VHSLRPITPLGGDTAKIDRIGHITITENPDWALASVASRLAREAEAESRAQQAIGTALPGPGRSVAGDVISAFWTGPGQWMLTAPHATHEDLSRILKDQIGDAASVTEQNDGWCRFDITGDTCADLFERLCAADTRGMETGAATRSVIDHLGCFVICHDAGRHFAVLGPRSSAGSLHHALVTAARSIA